MEPVSQTRPPSWQGLMGQAAETAPLVDPPAAACALLAVCQFVAYAVLIVLQAVRRALAGLLDH